jgi:hypothetical protein
MLDNNAITLAKAESLNTMTALSAAIAGRDWPVAHALLAELEQVQNRLDAARADLAAERASQGGAA